MAAKTARRKRKRVTRKRLPRVHAVSARLSVGELAKAGSALTLEIFGSVGKLGALEIGRGSLFWTGRGRHGSKRIRWPDFATMMDQLAYGESVIPDLSRAN